MGSLAHLRCEACGHETTISAQWVNERILGPVGRTDEELLGLLRAASRRFLYTRCGSKNIRVEAQSVPCIGAEEEPPVPKATTGRRRPARWLAGFASLLLIAVIVLAYALPTLPNLVGMSESAAGALVVQRGLILSIRTLEDRTVARGTVLQQSATPGLIPWGSAIAIVVAHDSRVIVPDVSNAIRDSAVSSIRTAGLRVVRTRYVYSGSVDKAELSHKVLFAEPSLSRERQSTLWSPLGPSLRLSRSPQLANLQAPPAMSDPFTETSIIISIASGRIRYLLATS